jgi:hypothetical protein
MIIQKQADQLQPGDILPDPRRVIVAAVPQMGNTACIGVFTVSLGEAMSPQPVPKFFDLRQTVDVEVPDPILTPAQVHAEELLELARMVSAVTAPPGTSDAASIIGRAHALINKIEPKPVTLDEVLRALVNAEPKFAAVRGEGDRRIGPLLDILDRARRTGAL